jgi:hypothetical protein
MFNCQLAASAPEQRYDTLRTKYEQVVLISGALTCCENSCLLHHILKQGLSSERCTLYWL